MKYKTSYFNRAIIVEDLKRLWGLSVLYFLLLFFAGPMEIIQRMGNPNANISYTIKRFFNMGIDMQIVFSIAFGIILSILVYSYLQNSRSTTVMHSFPITRRELFHSHNIAGIILILLPVMINAIILIGLMAVNNDGSLLYKEIFTIQNIFIWMGKTLLIDITIYLLSVLTAMFTGTPLVQGVISFIFIFLPIGLTTLILANLDQLLYGFTSASSILEDIGAKIIPVIYIIGETDITTGLVIWYSILCITLYVSAYYFYKNRHLERASDPIAFDKLKPVFKYGVTFSAMVLGGAYFYSLESINAWLYVGYVIGGVLGYLIAEMLIKKSIWIFKPKNFKGLGIYSLVIIICIVGIKVDLIGFERRIPELDKVEAVYYGYGVYSYLNGSAKGLKNKDNIEAVIRLHQDIIDKKKEFSNTQKFNETRGIGLVYKLDNGRKIVRDYTVPIDYINNNENIKFIYESEEYKRNYYDIFSIDITEVDYIEINPAVFTNRNVKIFDDIEINEMIEIIKEDILEESYEEYIADLANWANIAIRFEETQQESDIMDTMKAIEKEKRIYVSWKKHYDNLTKWLKSKGYYENARVMPEDIDYIVIEEADKNLEFHEIYKTIEEGILQEGKNRVEIRDKDKIEYFLQNYREHKSYGVEYVIGFYLKNGDSFIGSIPEEILPREVKNKLK